MKTIAISGYSGSGKTTLIEKVIPQLVLAGLNERRRELAVLRSIGAGPPRVLALLALEGGLLTATGIALGLVLWWLAVATLGPWLQSRHGLALTLSWPSAAEWSLLGGVFSRALLPDRDALV